MSVARVLAVVGRALITAGVVLLLFVGFQLWGTGLTEARAQAALADEFEEALAAAAPEPAPAPGATPTTPSPEPSPEPSPDPSPDPAQAEGAPENPPLSSFAETTVVTALFPEPGTVTARLRIPAIGVDKLVVEGVRPDDLRRGPGHYPGTAQPGFEGNVGIAGHRTTYGQPFRDLDRLAVGDRIEVTTLVGTFVYEVLDPVTAFGDRLDDVAEVLPAAVVVAPQDRWVLDGFGDDRITLTACHPVFSARQRIVVAARLLQPARAVPPDLPPPAVAFADPGRPPAPTAPTGPDTDAGIHLTAGLDGERSALLPALLFGAAALVCHLATVAAARDRRRLPVHLAGAVPTLVALWLCFGQVDRLLPAY